MSVYMSSEVWRNAPQELGGGRLLVLLALADAANDDGLAWISKPTIVKKSHLSERQVRRVLDDLVDLGHLEDLGPHTDPKYRGAIVYRVAIPAKDGRTSATATPRILSGTPRIDDTAPPASCPDARGVGTPQSIRNPIERGERATAPPPSPLMPTAEEAKTDPEAKRQRAVAVATPIIQSHGGRLADGDGDLLESEWIPAFKGLDLEQIRSVYATAKGAVAWPSDFRDLREAWELDQATDIGLSEKEMAKANRTYSEDFSAHQARAKAAETQRGPEAAALVTSMEENIAAGYIISQQAQTLLAKLKEAVAKGQSVGMLCAQIYAAAPEYRPVPPAGDRASARRETAAVDWQARAAGN